jgi:hypothetical protein
MPTSDHADDDRSLKPLARRRRLRGPAGLLAAATAAAVLCALVAAVAIARTGPDPTDSAPPQETTTPARPRAVPAPSPSTRPSPSPSSDGNGETAATDSGDVPIGGAGPSRSSATTTTTLPGVVDQHDPNAVVRAVVNLAASGVFPEDAAPYLASGDEQIATELFVFTAEGIARYKVGECTTSGAGRRARCTAAIETSYGAQASVEFALDRAGDADPWYVSTIQMTGGGPIGLASTIDVGH